MNKTLTIAAAALIGITAFSRPALAQDLGVSLSIGQPGFYGRIDLGDAPRPRTLYRQPVLIERQRYAQEPLYLHVRPGQARRWKRHCHEYNACGRQVYFVNDDWYNTVYVPHYQDRNRGDRDDHHNDRRHDGHDYRRDGDHHGRRGDNRHDRGRRGDRDGRDNNHGGGNR